MRPIRPAWILVCVTVVALPRPVAADAPAVNASSVFDSRYQPEYAVDGNPETRWASALSSGGGAQWLRVDLGNVVPVGNITILWEAAYAVDYDLQVSGNGREWKTLREVRGAQGGRQRFADLGGEGRYLRILCRECGPFPLYSIWEIESGDPTTAQALKEAARRSAAEREAQLVEGRKRLVEGLKRQGIGEIVFAVRQPGVDGHWYANFGYYAADVNQKCYRAGGGQLVGYDANSGRVRTIFADPQGSVRDPQVHHDGRKVLFSYLRGGTSHYHLYEINADGTSLRQLTDGDCDDIEPCYLPDGGIMFCSSRCNRWVNCWLTPVAVLYRCESDGSHVRPLSSNNEHDNTPWVLPDGRVLYTRWEYIDRSQVDYHHLWTSNPDGTGQTVYYGNLHPGTVMIDAKPIPGSDRVLSLFSPGHGQQEHQGYVTIVDPGDGPDDRGRARMISHGADFRDPYPIGGDLFLVARGPELQLMNSDGETVIFYKLPDEAVAKGMWCHEPRALTSHPRERVIPSRVDPNKSTGRLLLANVYEGRNMAGVRRGDIRKLLVLEALPKPINYTGGMDPLTYGGTFTLERVVGTVPVEADGSAYFELPALRSFFFVALDEKDVSVKRMQSFLTVQPGETMGCVGCHERRTRGLSNASRPMALSHAPKPPTPLKDIPEVFDFPRDIQPLLDRHCARCHDYDRASEAAGADSGPRAGGVILTGDRGPMYSHSYYMLTLRGQFVDGRNNPRSNLPPRTVGAVASPLMQKVLGGHHGVALSRHEIDLIRYWIESGAPYPGTYGALGSGMIGGYYSNNQVGTDWDWAETKTASEAIVRRCLSCHTGPTVLPRNLSDEGDVSFWRPDWSDPRLRMSRHLVFNLTRPGKSLMLLAPLARQAGGYGICRAKKGDESPPVFSDTNDPDYRAILAMCERGRTRLEEIKRFDMPGFRPPEAYLREMTRYGVLSAIPPRDAPADTYVLDRAYWRSLWWLAEPRRG